MSVTIAQNYSAVSPGTSFAQFAGSGGTAPYVYSVLSNGAGGTINSSTGVYTAPAQMTAYPPTHLYDTIQVTDSLGASGTTRILVGTPLFLAVDILQTELGIPDDHIYLWDQKLFQPTDSTLYIAVSQPLCKPYSNNIPTSDGDGSVVVPYTNIYARLDIDAISRGPAARDQKEQIVLAMNSIYSQQQQEANGFYLGKIPITNGFINLSHVDGAAIPYRYKISYSMQYFVTLNQTVPYLSSFAQPTITTNP